MSVTCSKETSYEKYALLQLVQAGLKGGGMKAKAMTFENIWNLHLVF